MNGDISRIPIQSLGAVFSLTDILPELPLPTAVPHGPDNESFLADPTLSSDAMQCLLSKNETLVSMVTDSLSSVNTDNIDLNDNHVFENYGNANLPPLLISVLKKNDTVFNPKRILNAESQVKHHSSYSKLNVQKNLASGDLYGSLTELSSSPSRKKHKKKKHRKRKSEQNDDASSGVDSAAATPAGSSCGARSTNADDLTSPVPHAPYGVSVNVNPNEKKILLKFSLKRPSVETKSNHIQVNDFHKNKKEKKSRRSKDHERKRNRSLENKQPSGINENSVDKDIAADFSEDKAHSVVDARLSNSTQCPIAKNGVLSLPARDTHVSPNSQFTESTNRRNMPPNSTPSLNSMFDSITAMSSTSSLHQPLDMEMGFAPSIAQIRNHNANKTEYNSPPENFLNDLSALNELNQQNAHPNNSLMAAFPTIMDYNSYIPADLLSVNPSLSMPVSSQQSTTHQLSCMSIKSSQESKVYRGSFMIAAHLEYDSKHPNHEQNLFLDNIPTTATSLHDFNSNAMLMSTPQKTLSNSKRYDVANLADPLQSQATPMGLASYLNASQQSSKASNTPANAHLLSISKAMGSSGKPPRRRPAISRRRRRDELEGLRSWAVKYPTGAPNSAGNKSGGGDRLSDETSSWDATVGSYSQVLGASAKRRKRMSRHPSLLASDFVFENDKDYPKPLPPRSADVDNNNETGQTLDTSGSQENEANSCDDLNVHTRGSRTSANKCSYAGMDDNEEVAENDCFKDPDNSNRRRRKNADDDEPFEVRLKEPAEQRFPHLKKAAEQARPTRERVRFKVAGVQFTESSASVSSLKKFLSRVDKILEAVEDLDLLTTMIKGCKKRTRGNSGCVSDPSQPVISEATGSREDEEEEEEINAFDSACVSAEVTIAPSDLAELARDTAKLKSTGSSNQVPTDQLLKLLTLLLLNIRDGANVVPTISEDEHADKHESRLWKEIAMERITRSVQSGLVSITLMTSREMPREIYLEDVIEQTVQVTRFQLSNSIYPEYDPAYRFENSAKDNQSSIKFRRARERDTHKPPAIVNLYYRLVEIVSGLAELVNMQRLTDSLVLTLSSLGVSAFFVENVSELQLAALKLVTGIFAQYEAHRNLIVDDIITSISRLPTSKKNLRTYRLNSEESIQMFTALALLLVQSVIELPSRVLESKSLLDSATIRDDASTAGGAQQDSSKSGVVARLGRPDDEVLVTTSYLKAMRTAHSFLAVFLKKSTTKGEDDYRVIFENFVNDLLLTVNKPEWPAAEVMLSLLGRLLVQQFNNKSLDQSIRVTSVDYLGTVASTLRRDAVTSQLKEHDIDVIIRELIEGSQSDSCVDDEEEENVKKAESIKKEDGEVDAASEVKEDEVAVTTEDKDCGENGVEASLKSDVEAELVQQTTKDSEPKVADEVKKLTATNGKRNRRKQESCKSETAICTNTMATPTEMDRILLLRDATLDYLLEDESDTVALYACKFYMAQWLEDCSKEVERAQHLASSIEAETTEVSPPENPAPSVRKSNSRKSANMSVNPAVATADAAERRRQYLMDRLRDPPNLWRSRCRSKAGGALGGLLQSGGTSALSRQSEALRAFFKGSIDYEDAYLICRYLASLRPFSQSFDVYLSQICKLLSESSVAVRTKALRCLSAVVEADPGVLARCDIEMAVRSRLLDTSTSVREAAVDLLGRFLVCRPELTAQYYPMLSDRIRDKGVSVRKRVIRILRDICIEQPDFSRVADICVMIIRRVNDEESVKKLVNEVFQTLWFTPVRDKESVKLLRKVMNITDVVAASKESGYEWFEQFLESLLTKEETEKFRPVEKACVQIVECLVQNIMRLEEIPGQTNRLVACLATLHLFTKIRPHLMIKHAMLLQPYLSIRGHGSSDAFILHYVARILEVTVPLLEHPSETFLMQLEEDMVRLTLRQGKIVLESCVACLGSVVNKVSKNYALTRDCFSRFFNALVRFKDDLISDPQKSISPQIRPSILRALFTVGLLCKHFDPEVFQRGTEPKILDLVFETLMFFSEQMKSDLDMRKKALAGLGFLCTRHHDLLCGPRLSAFYHKLLQTVPVSVNQQQSLQDGCVELKDLVLENILNFFLEEERRMLDADAKWKANHKEESLKIMGDVASGIGSHVAQAYLKDIMEAFFSPSAPVRLTSLSVITTILRQGLIHPVQTVPYLIAMQTDVDPNARFKAENQLQEIDNKFPGFISMRASQGVCLSYRLQMVLHLLGQTSKTDKSSTDLSNSFSSQQQTPQKSSTVATRRSSRHQAIPVEAIDSAGGASSFQEGAAPAPITVAENDLTTSVNCADYGAIRGSRNVDSDVPSALNSQLYSMLRTNRGQRRSFLNGLISLFDDSQQRLSLGRLVYVADNLAFFPYQSQEEPLFIIHHIDLLVSMNGSTLLQSVREALFPEMKAALDATLATQQRASETQAADAIQGPSIPTACEAGGHLFVEQPRQWHSVAFTSRDMTSNASTQSTSMLFDVDEEDEDALVDRILQADLARFEVIRETIQASRACLLLLNLKQYLKDVYGMTDSKVQKYSPTDSSKLWEKPLTRRSGIRFVPALCLRSAAEEIDKEFATANAASTQPSTEDTTLPTSASGDEANSTTKDVEVSPSSPTAVRALIQEYLEFRKLILSIDPPDEEEPGTADASLIGGQIGNGAASEVTAIPVDSSDQPLQLLASPDVPVRLPPGRSLVPQSHGRSSSEEENDSDDSNAGGASRLLLAQSAPQRRRNAGGIGSSAVSRNARGIRAAPMRRRSTRQKRLRIALSSSGEDSNGDSPYESDVSGGEST